MCQHEQLVHGKGKWDLYLMQEKQSVYTRHVGDCPNVFLCFALLWKEHCSENSRQYSILKQYTASQKVIGFQQDYLFFHCLCFCCILPVFSLRVKEAIFLACTTIDFLPFPQPVQRMSYFKGQDGGQSQVTSFYRSTPQTSMPPSHARQKAVLLRSTGKLPHQSYIPHKPLLDCRPALTTSHGENLLLPNYCESSVLLPRQSKRLLIALIAIDLS